MFGIWLDIFILWFNNFILRITRKRSDNIIQKYAPLNSKIATNLFNFRFRNQTLINALRRSPTIFPKNICPL